MRRLHQSVWAQCELPLQHQKSTRHLRFANPNHPIAKSGDCIAPRASACMAQCSTATIYRHSFDREMDEASGELGGNEPGAPDTWNFSIDVAKEWEKAFFSIST